MVTFCRDSVAPVAAEEGLTGILSRSNAETIIRNYGDFSAFTEEEASSNNFAYHDWPFPFLSS